MFLVVGCFAGVMLERRMRSYDTDAVCKKKCEVAGQWGGSKKLTKKKETNSTEINYELIFAFLIGFGPYILTKLEEARRDSSDENDYTWSLERAISSLRSPPFLEGLARFFGALFVFWLIGGVKIKI